MEITEQMSSYVGCLAEAYFRRPLQLSEATLLQVWCSERRYDADLIGAALQITVEKAGNANLSYADSILRDWDARGIKTCGDLRLAGK